MRMMGLRYKRTQQGILALVTSLDLRNLALRKLAGTEKHDGIVPSSSSFTPCLGHGTGGSQLD
jgi:hypothetical protein